MNQHPFYKLAPFIQEWVYRQGWEELRPIQVEACRVIFETEAHLLLATGTASGKTEAAFLPTITLLNEKPSASIGILYISPLKALINDQFKRLGELLQEADIQVWRWHGDVSRTRKQKLVKNPSGVLQITPESMESLLLNKTLEIRRMFGDLRFIIIDEVHALMGSERGSQILCQLERLFRRIGYHPRRIGLSATLGDYSLAETWLKAGTNVGVITPLDLQGSKRIRLAIEHFFECNPSPSALSGISGTPPEIHQRNAAEQVPGGKYKQSHRYLFEQTLGKKCLIFTNSREQAETAISSLRTIAESKNAPVERYHIHHGSIAGALREETETIMKDDDLPTVTAATVTLELGIDIGNMERIIQLKAPRSVSSFLQRLGRSGRRSNLAEILFVHSEDEPSDNKPLPFLIPWDLLQSIAIIQLYLEEKWIEPIPPLKAPFSLLYHQTMSMLASMGELSPKALAQKVLTLEPFKNVTQEDFKELLRHLLAIKHIERMENGGLIVGLEGEKIVRNYRFYAVFQDIDEWTVKEKTGDGTKEIGKLGTLMMTGERFPLAGYVWEVTEAFPEQKTMLVKKIGGKMRYIWPGGIGDIHTKVLQRMRKVLFEESWKYSYLQKGAIFRLEQARKLAKDLELDKKVLFQLSDTRFCLFPWMGTTAFRTLERIIRFVGGPNLNITKVTGFSPYYLQFDTGPQNIDELQKMLKELCDQVESPYQLMDASEKFIWRKYDEYLPVILLKKAFASDYLSINEVRANMKTW